MSFLRLSEKPPEFSRLLRRACSSVQIWYSWRAFQIYLCWTRSVHCRSYCEWAQKWRPTHPFGDDNINSRCWIWPLDLVIYACPPRNLFSVFTGNGTGGKARQQVVCCIIATGTLQRTCLAYVQLDRVTPSQMPCTGTEIALCWYRSIRKCAPIFDEYAVDRASYQRWTW